MKSVKPGALILMAIVLALATAATAATGFAGNKKKHIGAQVADSVQGASQAILRLKARNIRLINDTVNPTIYLPRAKN